MSASSSPSLGKSRWTRMGSAMGAMRRASSILVPSRPGTPSISSERDTDATSMKGSVKDTATVEVAPVVVAQPSPIAESPARELQASQEDLNTTTNNVDPSPLTQLPITASPVQEYTPPPLIDSTASGPGGFSDELDELPQPDTILDPSFSRKDTTATTNELEHADEPKPKPDDHTPSTPPPVVAATTQVPTVPSTPEPPATAPPLPPPEETSMPEPVVPQPEEEENRTSYFEIPVRTDNPESAPLGFNDEDAAAQSTKATTISPPKTPDLNRSPNPQLPMPVDHDSEQVMPLPPIDRNPVPVMPTPELPNPHHEPVAMPSATPAYPGPPFDYHSPPPEDVWGDVPTRSVEEPKPSFNQRANAGSSNSTQMPAENPFLDPVGLPPNITVSQPEPTRAHTPRILDEHQLPHPATDDGQQQTRAIVMPLPLGDQGPSHVHTQSEQTHVNETTPLLSRQGSLKYGSHHHLQPPSAASRDVVNVSAQSGAQSPYPWSAQHQFSAHKPRLHDLGWIEYHLPDGVLYYVHPTRRVTADIDLRVDAKLDAVVAYLEQEGRKDNSHSNGAGAPAGMELWLREQENKGGFGRKRGLRLSRLWVDHRQRVVLHDQSLTMNGYAGRRKATRAEDDHLDAEYRYWSFIEGHPAHVTLPPNSKNEATEVLTWAWTDRLLPSHRSVPAPFTQEECQELTGLLRSFEQGETGLQNAVHTRIVSRILLRVAHWRQQHFRPQKPLPTDVGSHTTIGGSPKHNRKPFRRAFFDFIISCVCLGIPYLFFERNRHYSRIDEESGSGARSPGPMLVIGACACLVAAIILSASVTFLSLPGLDNFARVAGLVSILFATFSMGSTVVAIFRYKAELDAPVSHIAGEGLTMLSRRSVTFSLPLVFLVYSVVAFSTGIVLYSFRGTADDGPFKPQRPFEEYTRWTVVGVLGGLAGILMASIFLMRR